MYMQINLIELNNHTIYGEVVGRWYSP